MTRQLHVNEWLTEFGQEIIVDLEPSLDKREWANLFWELAMLKIK